MTMLLQSTTLVTKFTYLPRAHVQRGKVTSLSVCLSVTVVAVVVHKESPDLEMSAA